MGTNEWRAIASKLKAQKNAIMCYQGDQPRVRATVRQGMPDMAKLRPKVLASLASHPTR